MRADAQRNRHRLLEAAREAFTSGDDKISLESIARAAGVGIGTLYRHFPTREELVDSVYRAEFETLCADLDRLQDAHPPATALRALMDRLSDYMTTKRDLAEAMRTARESSQLPLAEKQAILAGKIGETLRSGAEDGTLRGDVAGEDVFAALIGILSACPRPDQRDQAGRLMDLLMDGLRR